MDPLNILILVVCCLFMGFAYGYSLAIRESSKWNKGGDQ